MTDLPDSELHEELLLLDAFDGDPEAVARVADDARLASRLSDMVSNRDALLSSAVEIEPARRELSISAALDVFDGIQASAGAATATAAVLSRRRSLRLFRSAGAVAASAAVVVGIVAIGPNLGGSSDDATTIAAGDTTATTVTANAELGASSADADDPSSSPSAARESAETTFAPATTVAPSFTIATTTTAVPAAESAVEPADIEAPADDAGLDPQLVECAELALFDSTPSLDTSAWILSRPADDPDDPIRQRWVVVLDSGMELDLVYEPDSCRFVEIGEPRTPSPTTP